MTVTVDISRSGRTQAGVVWTGLALRLGAYVFPTESWTDFTVVVLSSWIGKLVLLLQGGEVREELVFMEGPFSVELEASTTRIWQVTCVERTNRGTRRTTRAQGSVDPHQLAEDLAQAAETVLALCRSMKWWSSDADILEQNLRALREAKV